MNHLSAETLLLSAVVSGALSIVSNRLRWLSFSGSVAAFLVGFAILGLGGTGTGGALFFFFVSSSLLSHVGWHRKRSSRDLNDKSSCRDAGQVFSNGGVAALLCLGAALALNGRSWALAAIAALAAAAADTWATEIGGLSRARPLLAGTLRRVPTGTSGGVTLLGFIAAAAGACAVVAVAWAAWPPRSVHVLWRPDLAELMALAWSGFVGAIADSLLGATLQAQYECPACGALSERRAHCHQEGRLKHGTRRMNNDTVNFIATALAAASSVVLIRVFAGDF